MEERKSAVRNYIIKKVEDLKSHNIYMEEDKIEKLVEKYASKEENMQEITKGIDKEIDQLISNYKLMQELRKEYQDKIEVNKDIQDLPFEYSGIEIDKENEELMNIKSSNNPEELKEAIEEASNINPTLEDINYSNDQILAAQKEIYKLHQDVESDKNEYQRDTTSMVNKKLNYLEDVGKVTEKERETLSEVISTSSSTNELVDKLKNNYDEEKAKDMYEMINDDTPLDQTSIKNDSTKELSEMFDSEKEEEKEKQFIKEKEETNIEE